MERGQGLSLVELAVVMLIVALLLAAALIPFSTQIDLKNTADTQRTMESIKEAVMGFVQANGRLPCPANGTTPDGGVDTTTWPPNSIAAGVEQWDPAAGARRCLTASGVVPWATLGVLATDAWGRRFSYRVSPAFADDVSLWKTWSSVQNAVGPPALPAPQTVPSIPSPQNQTPACNPAPAPALSSFALCSLGDIVVFTRSETTHAVSPLGAGVPVVIISHGKNGYGAFQATGNRIIGPNDLNADGVPDQDVDEAANATGNTVAALVPPTYNQWAFYSRSPIRPTSPCSDTAAGQSLCEFDDIVVFVTSNVLIARMVSAGRLP